jgi:hypothetical protein
VNELHSDTPDQYALRFLGTLLSLKEDHVVNVRLSLGTFLYQNLVHNGKTFDQREIGHFLFVQRILFRFVR